MILRHPVFLLRHILALLVYLFIPALIVLSLLGFIPPWRFML